MAGINFGPKGGRNSRKEKKGQRGNSTPGSQKGPTCQASSLDRYFAGYARAYKKVGYQDWCDANKG